jgi:biopolymer transport protein ExbD
VAAPRVKAFDVWFVAANTVYKQVPYGVVADWAGQGRLAARDMLRPAGTADAWKRVDQFELLADYLPAAPAPAVTAVAPSGETTTVEAHATAGADHWPRAKDEGDDDVDMIPLIDISMVLLVFFIMMQTASSLAPVDVPDMTYAGPLTTNPNAITIVVDKASETEVAYSVHVGEQPPKPEYDNLKGYEGRRAAVRAVEALLPDTPRPREVRIACRRDLPSERVFELLQDLKPRKDDGSIFTINAEVHEAKQKQ